MSLRAPSKAPDSPERVWVKLFRLLLICGALGMVVLVVGFFYITRDVPALDDSSLRVPTTTVPDSQNGLLQTGNIDGKTLSFADYAFKQGVSLGHIENVLDFKVRDDALVSSYLAQAQPELDQLAACFAQPYFEFPQPIDLPWLAYSSPKLDLIFYGVQANALRGQTACDHQDYAQAIAAITEIHQISARLIEGYPSITAIMISATADEMAGTLTLELLDDASLPKDALAQLIALYSKPLDWRLALQNSIKQEYEIFLAKMNFCIQNPQAFLTQGRSVGSYPPVLMRYWFIKNLTQNQAIAYYTQTIKDLNGPYSKVDARALSDPEHFASIMGFEPSRHFLLGAIQPNFAGRFLLFDCVGTEQTGIQGAYEMIANDRLLQTGLATRSYFDAHHTLPPTLAALVPDYVPSVPIDPFDGKPLRYDASRGQIFSIGTSLKDSGGRHPTKTPLPGGAYFAYGLKNNLQPTIVLTFQNAPKDAAAR